MTKLFRHEPALWSAFTLASALEGLTLLLLIGVAVPLKHLANWPEGVRLLGPLHGLAFLAYHYCLFRLKASEALSISVWLTGILASLLPGGSWIFRKRLEPAGVPLD